MKISSSIEFFVESGGTLKDGTPIEADGYGSALLLSIGDEHYFAGAATPKEELDSMSAEQKEELKWELLNDMQRALMGNLGRKFLKDIEPTRLEIARNCLKNREGKEFVG